VPGVIGKVGTILGKHRVNIANMALGRGESIGEVTEALALIVVDGEIPAVVLDELRGLEPVQDVRAVRI
jgi:D-3-phosphoglycerate dehydrogenase